MKHLTIYIIIALVALTSLCAVSCSSDPYQQDISLILDLTEPDFTYFEMEEVLTISAVHANPSNGESARILPLTELSLNPIVELQIEPVTNRLLGNDVERRHEVKTYFDKIEDTLTSLTDQAVVRQGSVIFKIVSEELRHLSASKAESRLLILNSDLMEFSSLENFYNSQSLKLMREQPEKMQQKFETAYPLPDLAGIQIVLVFKPKSQDESEIYEVVSGFYRTMLESQGASVSISANLPKNLAQWKR